MNYSLTWLADVLHAAQLKVSEVPDWRTRGLGDMGSVRGIICHHTGGAPGHNMPNLGLLISGRADLRGPLSQLGLGRDGTFYIIAAGRCQHAGKGVWHGQSLGNSNFIGIEAENSGRANDLWPAVQMDAYARGVAAILGHLDLPAGMCCGHKEWAPGRKVDPSFDMEAFRSRVQGFMSGAIAQPALIPAVDAKARPTLRRGARGDAVKQVQEALGLIADGIFGAATEAKLRALQREADLVPDGIVGPRTWEAIDAARA